MAGERVKANWSGGVEGGSSKQKKSTEAPLRIKN